MSAHCHFGLGVVLAPVLALALGASGAAAGAPGVDHCISPSGLDTNLFYDLDDALIAPDPFVCNTIESGRRWRVLQAWFMNQEYGAKPKGFKPWGETPLDDFLAKFEYVKYVVDPDTEEERTYVFTKSDALYVNPDAGGDALVNPVTLGSLHPLIAGEHRVEVYWKLRAMHCDGLGKKIDENCLPGGEEFPFLGMTFQVVKRED